MIKYNQNIIGQKFGRLLVVKMSTRRVSNQRYWDCLCECGEELTVRTDALLHRKNPSCRNKIHRQGKNSGNWQGHGELPSSYLNRIKHQSQRRNRDCDLDLEFLWNLFLQQERKCALSGVELSFGKTKKDLKKNASLDRIDSNKGYVKGNVWWVDKKINFMKQRFSVEEFIKMCKNVVNNNRE